LRKILVCEDEDTIRDFIVINLRRNGFDVVEAKSGEEALAKYQKDANSFDVALLDIMLPDIDGFQICKDIRSKNKSIGIIMLSAKTQEMDKVTGLMLGADDYMTKPFSPSELTARLDALCRRVTLIKEGGEGFKEEITLGEFTLNLKQRFLMKNGQMIDLTQIEFQLMEFFFENPGMPLDRTAILNRIWGEAYVGEEKIVDVNIRRLRMKLEDNPSNPKKLVTVWGLGYKWET